MISYLSGEAARGAIITDGKIFGLSLDDSIQYELSESQLRRFFLNATDVERVECESSSDLISRIELAWKRDRTVRLMWLALDGTQTSEVRKECALLADELLHDEACKSIAQFDFYARPLPDEVDPLEVASLLSESGSSRFEEFFDTLVLHQQSISSCSQAWAQIPDSVFSDSEDRERVRGRVARIGIFYQFASKGADNNTLLTLLTDPVLASHPAKTRELFATWAAQYREMPKAPHSFDDLSEEDSLDNQSREEYVSSYAAYQRVIKQRAFIKHQLQLGNTAKAAELIEALIASQRRESSAEHLAKSLCDLANYARSYGDADLHYRLSLRATEEAPGDAWARVQLGYAFLTHGEYASAMDAFERARVLGDERAALLGKAETLKLLGQMDTALEILDDCISSFPADSIARNARASVLAHFGRFGEALREYNHLADTPFAESHTFGGRAGVLAELGDLEGAIRDSDVAIYLASNGVIPYCAKSDVLREAGLFEAAAETLARAPSSFSGSLQVQHARVRILRDQGRYDEAFEVLMAIREKYPRDLLCRIAIAELARRTGDNERALGEYRQIETEFPRSRIARTSLSAIYSAIGDFDRALAGVPIHPISTRGDWVASHVRAVTLMRMGELAEAESLLQQGVAHCPWRQQIPFFATTLAVLQVRQSDFASALHTIERSGTPETPAAISLVSAVKSHVLAASGKLDEAKLEIENAKRSQNPVLVDFVAFMSARIRDKSSVSTLNASKELFDRECVSILALAA